jgi:hypothetical protein
MFLSSKMKKKGPGMAYQAITFLLLVPLSRKVPDNL